MRRFPHWLVLALVVAAGVLRGPQGLLYAGIAAAVVELGVLRFGMVDLDRVRWRRSRPAVAPDALARSFSQLRDELVAGTHSRREFDRGLRVRLMRILTVALREHRNVALDREPERAQAIVAAEVWDLLAPGRPPVLDRDRPGVDLARVAQTVDGLERL